MALTDSLTTSDSEALMRSPLALPKASADRAASHHPKGEDAAKAETSAGLDVIAKLF